ncbi:phosphoesterase family-domain-containing protein [Aspergillus pseudoustus]|uniref:Phosphoesterase family-domain-containing protein n=1 Tax=Aspergillus pseudoustus TaxID=1810923 RepID=A0ABR4K206_9EURO
MRALLGSALVLLLGASAPATAASLRDIQHVVIFMQENRSWNHYFGTMAGVRGFNDPNVQVNADGRPVWNQTVTPSMSSATDTLLPWYLGYKDTSDALAAIQCMNAGSNGYTANQAALNDGLNNMWARNNTPWSWGYLKRSDIPIHFAIAEGWTAGDMYQESQITATNPNRVTLVSGSINVPGSPQTPDQGGPYIDNNETPGCENNNVNCYPLKWKTIYEIYQAAGVSWQVYQDTNNFDDNPLAWFEQYQNASDDSPIAQRGLAYLGLDAFYAAAANGSLPEISFIVGPAELSEHPPYMPKDGAWLQKKVVDAVTKSPKYDSTVLMMSYDETGGWGDHVTPFHSPQGTPGEWMEDPYGYFGQIFTGPGFRVPFYIVSPWTRGGRVFTERADHNSQILFLEEWLEARGYEDVRTPEMVPWRREHMSSLVNALDFSRTDTSLPDIPDAEAPLMSGGKYIGTATCEATYPVQRPLVPYEEQQSETLHVEQGFKEVIGDLTEGRFLVFEADGHALTNAGGRGTSKITQSKAQADHSDKHQRWVIHYTADEESGIFHVSSALDGRWIGKKGALVSQQAQAANIKITFLGNGKGYKVAYTDGFALVGGKREYRIWSVTYL